MDRLIITLNEIQNRLIVLQRKIDELYAKIDNMGGSNE